MAVSMCSRRSSSHRTGRPKRIVSSGISTSSGYTMSLAPKPPPTSGAITRTRWGSRPSSSQTNWRTWCGTWEDAHTVSSPAIELYSATRPRVSIGWPPARPMVNVTLARRGAAFSAAVTSPRESVTRPARLSGMSSCTRAEPGAVGSCTEGSGSQATSIRARASSAA
ncbi:MAG: hypothetical protein DME15_14425 [Candidatus Rokuibacteriota bacterium]|nr:MAG: hypothetical protein DME15_14425 [Candidatus Rokubacteria bacterium]